MMYKILFLCANFYVVTSLWMECQNPTPLNTFDISKAVGKWITLNQYGEGFFSTLMPCPDITYTIMTEKMISAYFSKHYYEVYNLTSSYNGTEIIKGKYNLTGEQPRVGNTSLITTALTADAEYKKLMVVYFCSGEPDQDDMNMAFVFLRHQDLPLTKEDKGQIDEALKSVGFNTSDPSQKCT